MSNKNIETLIKQLLLELGENPDREGLKKTPRRVAVMLSELTKGYTTTRKETVNDAIFSERIHNMIILRDIELYSLCEHHLLPFLGKCHVGYIPKNQIIGVSKIARIVDRFAHRLQVQERLTQEIAKEIQTVLKPYGVGVIIEAQHLCMMMRGVEKQNSVMITSSVLGAFRDDQKTREEFMSFINRIK
ncbi:MAG TPA: GTP cyclohydrolase I FolE [Candidatus Acidoferrales bacterium]|nr:GTP cyclohydrolase I FolE [Candidatus Acidoferrales bacterium]